MKNYFIKYDERAEADLENIFEYLLDYDPIIAIKHLDKIDNDILHLSEFPLLGKDKGKYRRLGTKPYIVYYTVDDSLKK